jgi:glycosyltransferase involved in cell wall biosynthesis
MESRKNIWRLAQAWLRLTQTPGLDVPKLVFAGKPGWYNDDFESLMKATGNLGGWVQFAKQPSDTELGFLYENCLFTATVSLYEGWGLPIGESLSFGKTAVVADNSSMPEVGGDLVEYCDAHSISSIYDACHKLIADPDHRHALESKIAGTSLRTWDDVTNDFMATINPVMSA